MVGRELDVAMALIGEVFSVGGDEVRRMIKERMASRGMIRDRRAVKQEAVREEEKAKPKSAAAKAARSKKATKKENDAENS